MIKTHQPLLTSQEWLRPKKKKWLYLQGDTVQVYQLLPVEHLSVYFETFLSI